MKPLGLSYLGTLMNIGTVRNDRIGQDALISSSTRISFSTCLITYHLSPVNLLMALLRQCCPVCQEISKVVWSYIGGNLCYPGYCGDISLNWIMFHFFTAWSLNPFVIFVTCHIFILHQHLHTLTCSTFLWPRCSNKRIGLIIKKYYTNNMWRAHSRACVHCNSDVFIPYQGQWITL